MPALGLGLGLAKSLLDSTPGGTNDVWLMEDGLSGWLMEDGISHWKMEGSI